MMKLQSLGVSLALAIAVCANSVGQDAAVVKRPIHGLVTMGNIVFMYRGGTPEDPLKDVNLYPGIFSAAVINVAWEQLEPKRGVFDYSVIDSALAGVKAYNKHYPATPIVGKLRVFSGVEAPDWVKTMDGPAIPYLRRGARPVTLGRFWANDYRAEWRKLQDNLGARYDANPLLGEVSATSCSSNSDESFNTPLDAPTLALMHAGGFTDANHKACLLAVPEDYSAWKTTPLDFQINLFRNLDSGRPVQDIPFSLTVMKAWRKALGERGVLSNHELNNPPPSWLEPVYDDFKLVGPPIELQTQSPKQIKLEEALRYSIPYRPTEIEIWASDAPGAEGMATREQLQRWSDAMKKVDAAAKK